MPSRVLCEYIAVIGGLQDEFKCGWNRQTEIQKFTCATCYKPYIVTTEFWETKKI